MRALKTSLFLVSLLSFLSQTLGQPVQKKISFQDISQMARERAEKPFNSPSGHLPEELRGEKLNYDSYREIHFRHDKALWAREELPFRLEFYHPGYLYQTPVSLYEFNATHFQPIRFVQDFFDYGKLNLPKKIPADTGYAGFKLLYRLNTPERWDEVASFLGASYFRCLGQGETYGQSARGLAINCGEPGTSEEFPIFTNWWLGKPENESNTIRLYALLESESCTGAYDFLLRPGDTTFVDIEAVLYRRQIGNDSIKSLGIAPLTSMFWFGENSEAKPDDYRPEVHDSDGLLVKNSDEDFVWVPLKNPSALEHRKLSATNPRGFGLLQRDRQFSSYQDLFNAYHRVPSVWVEPRGNWGAGDLHLVQLPATQEGTDNIVVFWAPADKPPPLQPYRVAYTLHWAAEPDGRFPLAKVAQTRSGTRPNEHGKRQFVVDFNPANEVPNPTPPQVKVESTENSSVSDVQIFKNEVTRGWRVFFSLQPHAASGAPVDIQCWLQSGDKTVSEKWNYLWTPPSQKNQPK